MSNSRSITRSALRKRLSPRLLKYWIKGTEKYAGFGDTRYHLPTPTEASLLLFSARLPQQVSTEVFDCEDFAYFLKAHVAMMARTTGHFDAPPCIGIAWARFGWIGQDHACNWILDSNGDFSWIEPQEIAMGKRQESFHHISECSGRLTLLLV